ncbi:MAG TPA: MerR family transcriptional regulator [Haliangium sp.]|nr:MerR family transcriptional regulator [Haliangium sp.]
MTSRVSTKAQHETNEARIDQLPASDASGLATDAQTADASDEASHAPARSIVATTLAAYRRRRSGGASRGGSGGESSGGSSGSGSSGATGILSDSEIDAIEATYPDGITAVQVVELFTSRDVRFSEASFRKYVQLGLLPRSRRIGRKGKHRGSMGVYPAKTVRRINEIKRLMADGYTIEEIQAQFLRFTDTLETLEEGFSELFSRLEEEVAEPRFDNQTRRSLTRELKDARQAADDLLARLDGLSRRVATPQGSQYRSAGAAGSAEDLL